MRGLEKQNSMMTTSPALGSFPDDGATDPAFVSVIVPHG